MMPNPPHDCFGTAVTFPPHISFLSIIELAKKAIRDAQPQPTPTPEVPKPSATALEGNTTLDAGVKLETEMVSYKEADRIIKAKNALKDKRSKSIKEPSEEKAKLEAELGQVMMLFNECLWV